MNLACRRLPRWFTVAALLFAVGCGGSVDTPTVAIRSEEVMGTLATVNVSAPSDQSATAAIDAAHQRLRDVNTLMSDYIDTSEIGRLNHLHAGESLEVSPETFTCLQNAFEIADESGGAFDPTCRPLVWLWREHGKVGRLPPPEEIEQVRARIGWKNVELSPDSRTVTLHLDEMQLDLGGIAKGYALDLAAEAAKEAGATAGLIDVGGDIVAFGTRPNGDKRHIGVRDPFSNDRTKTFMTLELTDAAVATSGHQERYYEIDGHKYSHIIDPRTGRPVEHFHSVTVIGPTGLLADAWATAFSVLPISDAQALLAGKLKDTGLEVMWVAGKAEAPLIMQTPGFARYIKTLPTAAAPAGKPPQ